MDNILAEVAQSGGVRTKSREEWSAHWALPPVASLGATAAGIHIYTMGPFFQPLENSFHWSRAEISSGTTIAISLCAALNPVVGVAIDRIGPRIVALFGILAVCTAMGLLGTATGELLNWRLLWMLVAITAIWVQPMVWTSAVASRFDAARGIATGIVLIGPGLGAFIFPLLASLLLERYEWREAFFGIGAISAMVLLLPVSLAFRGAQDSPREKLPGGEEGGRKSGRLFGAGADLLPGLSFREGLRSPVFYALMLAGSSFTFTLVGLTVHFIPILADDGETRMAAAGIASLIGIFSAVGRLAVGALLDGFGSAGKIAAGCLLLPITGCALLILQSGWWSHALAAMLVGLGLGSEFDLVTYLATRHLGMKRFGMLFGAIMVPMSLGTATGPLVASAIHDHFSGYGPFLWLAMPLLAIGAASLVLLGPYPDFSIRNEHRKS